MLRLAQKQIHAPAPQEVRPWLPQVVKEGKVFAACFFQGIGKDGQASRFQVATEGAPFLGGGPRQPHHQAPIPGAPARVNRWELEWIPDQLAKQ